MRNKFLLALISLGLTVTVVNSAPTGKDELIPSPINLGIGIRDANEKLSLSGAISLKEQSSAAVSLDNFSKLYTKNDTHLYLKRSTGEEIRLDDIKFTQGSLIFASPSGLKAEDNDELFFNNNLGIGTKNPQAKLHVNGDLIASSFNGNASGITKINASSLLMKIDDFVDATSDTNSIYIPSFPNLDPVNYDNQNTIIGFNNEQSHSYLKVDKSVAFGHDSFSNSSSSGVLRSTSLGSYTLMRLDQGTALGAGEYGSRIAAYSPVSEVTSFSITGHRNTGHRNTSETVFSPYLNNSGRYNERSVRFGHDVLSTMVQGTAFGAEAFYQPFHYSGALNNSAMGFAAGRRLQTSSPGEGFDNLFIGANTARTLYQTERSVIIGHNIENGDAFYPGSTVDIGDLIVSSNTKFGRGIGIGKGAVIESLTLTTDSDRIFALREQAQNPSNVETDFGRVYSRDDGFYYLAPGSSSAINLTQSFKSIDDLGDGKTDSNSLYLGRTSYNSNVQNLASIPPDAGNTFMGISTGRNMHAGNANTLIATTGDYLGTSYRNTAVGYRSLNSYSSQSTSVTIEDDTVLGAGALRSNLANRNSILGVDDRNPGSPATNANANTVIGYNAPPAYYSSTFNNVFIGTNYVAHATSAGSTSSRADRVDIFGVIFKDNSGNVAIGPQLPTTKLDVGGNLVINGDLSVEQKTLVYLSLQSSQFTPANWQQANHFSQYVTYNGSTPNTLLVSFSQNPLAAAQLDLTIRSNGSKQFPSTSSWPSSVIWAGGGSAPDLSSFNGKSSVTVRCFYDTSNYFCKVNHIS